MITYLLVITLLSPGGQRVPVLDQGFTSKQDCTKELIATYATPMRGYTLVAAKCVPAKR